MWSRWAFTTNHITKLKLLNPMLLDFVLQFVVIKIKFLSEKNLYFYQVRFFQIKNAIESAGA